MHDCRYSKLGALSTFLGKKICPKVIATVTEVNAPESSLESDDVNAAILLLSVSHKTKPCIYYELMTSEHRAHSEPRDSDFFLRAGKLTMIVRSLYVSIHSKEL